MITIEIAYSCSTIIALLASASQVKQLLISKRSDELSPATWSVWSCTQFVSLLYALSLEQAVLIIANCIWITFYIVMISLIYYYRRNPGGRKYTVLTTKMSQTEAALGE
jgi:uncharacterized protein with PQ loop repeat